MRIAIFNLLLLTITITTNAQLRTGVIDKVIAVVGDKIILQSDIRKSVDDIARQGNTTEDAECMITEQAIISKILMLQGEKDSLPITDDYVQEYMDMQMKTFLKQAEADTTGCGKSLSPLEIEKMKAQAKPQLKENLLADAMKQKIIENIKITPSEVEAFFKKIPTDKLPVVDFDPESRNPARHIMNLQDDYVRISNLALDEKRGQAFDTWFKTHIPKIYVEVDDDTQAKCDEIKKYITYSSGN